MILTSGTSDSMQKGTVAWIGRGRERGSLVTPGDHCLVLPKHMDIFFPFGGNALGLLRASLCPPECSSGAVYHDLTMSHVCVTAASTPVKKL